VLRLIVIPLAGSVVGGLMGYFGQCTSGACPLTATWWRGAIFGAVIGLMFAVSAGRTAP
jgi:hypothetical protein